MKNYLNICLITIAYKIGTYLQIGLFIFFKWADKFVHENKKMMSNNKYISIKNQFNHISKNTKKITTLKIEIYILLKV